MAMLYPLLRVLNQAHSQMTISLLFFAKTVSILCSPAKNKQKESCENPKWDGLKTVSNEYHKPPLLTLPELFLSPVYMCFQMSGNSVPMSCPPSPLPVRYNLKLT